MHAIMEHVIGFAIHERVTAVPATKRKRGRVLRCWRGKASVTPWPQERRERISTGRRIAKRTTRTLAPNACGGKFEANFPFTTPELPCGRVTRLRC